MLRSLIAGLAVALTVAGCGEGEIDEANGHPVGIEDETQSVDSSLTVCAAGPTVEGIDVSKYQRTPNWHQVAASGKAFAITKLSQGSTIDPTFQANWDGMKAAGIIRGAYQWFLPNQDPIAQADLAVRMLGRLGPGELPVMADVEASPPYPAPAVYAARLKQWVDRIKAGTGKAPIIYSGYWYWRGALGNTTMFADLPLAHAQYTLKACPTIPDPWRTWTIWQYRGGGVAGVPDGTCPGIVGAVDQDHFNGSLAALRAFAGAGGPGPTPSTPPTAPACGALASGQSLAPGQSLTSCNGQATLAHQTDGNVVVYDNNNRRALWSSRTSGQASTTLVMQTAGNLVLYGAGPLWYTAGSGQPGSIAVMQDDGNLVVYGSGYAPMWASGTRVTPPPPTGCGTLAPGATLYRGQQLPACGGRFILSHQGDGNVVLYDRGVAIWHTHTNGKATTGLSMQGDGQLVLYNGTTPLWYSGTNGHPGAWLSVQTDGNLVVYDASGWLWASHTSRQ